ncbi:MAG: CBS domain-containing protein, partial [Chloroflexota bacterium]|nr:CBS domain-containing protein [Chloroflexota bacterium]
MSSDAMLAMAVWIIAIVLSTAVLLYRHALTRVESRNGNANGNHTGLSRSALQALMSKHMETAFTLFAVKVALDGIAIVALILYLSLQDTATWIFALSFVGGTGLALLLPLAFYPVLRGQWQRVALVGAPLGVVVTVVTGPVTVLIYKLLQTIVGRPESLPAITSELEARYHRVFIPLSKEVNPPDERELAMIHAILSLEEIAVRDIMVPRPDVVAIDVNAPITEALALMREAGHSRILAHDNGIDHVEGILHARD